jgi:hypothetical protein
MCSRLFVTKTAMRVNMTKFINMLSLVATAGAVAVPSTGPKASVSTGALLGAWENNGECFDNSLF